MIPGVSALPRPRLISAEAAPKVRAAIPSPDANAAALPTWRKAPQLLWDRTRLQTEPRKILIVGAGPTAHLIAQTLRSDPSYRAKVRGFVDDELPLSPVVLGRIADLDWLARAEFIDEVIVALPGQSSQARQAAEIAFRNHLDIRAVPDLPPGPWPDAEIDHIGEVPVVTLHREPSPGAALFFKRALDVTVAALALLLTDSR